MNWIGVVAALATFLSVWFGHVAVRKIEFISPTIWIPSTLFAALGLVLELLSVTVSTPLLSIALGILGITLLIDAQQISLQQKRVIKGRAPANPNNPRHAKILAEIPSATTQDLLKRGPISQTSSSKEAQPITNY